MDMLSGHLTGLRRQVVMDVEVASANAGIDASLALLKAGGVIPDEKLLADQISLVRKSIEEDKYTTKAEAEYARLDLANRLTALRDQAGDQLTQAEKDYQAQIDQVDSLDKLLQAQQTQLDALRGVDTSVQGVTAAIAVLQAAMTAERSGAGGGGGSGGASGGGGSAVSSAAAGQSASGFVTGGGSASAAELAKFIEIKKQEDAAAKAKLDAHTVDPSSRLYQYIQNLALINRLSGETQAQAIDRIKAVDLQESQRVANREALRASNPNGVSVALFATGGAFTNSVVSRPTAFNMGVMGEAGPEAIMPLSNVGGDLGIRATIPGVDGMVDELRALRKEVAMLRAEARATAINTGRTQDIMKRITKNGESMVVSTDGEALEVTAP
jgi:hypothetical protein